MPSPYFTVLPLALLIAFALVAKGQDHAPSGLDNVSDKFVGSGPDQPVDHPATGNGGDHAIKSSRTTQPDDSKTLTGKVVGITDGDTVTVYTGQGKPIKLRLEGIDAPESKQDFGDASSVTSPALSSARTSWFTPPVKIDMDGRWECFMSMT